MNTILIKMGLLLLPAFLLIWGCNSTIYDIEEIEEKVEVSTYSKPDSSFMTENTNDEIKQDLKQDNKILDNKFTDKQVVARVFAIQIGAFLNEDNASNFTDEAKELIDQTVYYKIYDDLYKVRIGNFNNMNEAAEIMEKLRNLGYLDSFMVELTYVQTQEK